MKLIILSCITYLFYKYSGCEVLLAVFCFLYLGAGFQWPTISVVARVQRVTAVAGAALRFSGAGWRSRQQKVQAAQRHGQETGWSYI